MIRRRKLRGRSSRYPRRWPAVVGWSAGALVAGAIPLLLAYLRGRSSPTKMGEAGNAVFDTLTQTIPGTAVSLLALIGLAWCVRRLSFEGARVTEFSHENPAQHDVENWVRAFEHKVREIVDRPPCPAT